MPIFEVADNEADARASAVAEADVVAGRLTPNAKVIEWLKSLGTSRPMPAPYSWQNTGAETRVRP